jgi:two-component system, OmpR family, phosphate regulon response regulator PhoB
MRKRILIVQNSETMSPVIREALDGGAFDLKWLSGLSDVIASVREHKPALVLFEISRWQKPMELLLIELMNLKNARLTRKVILSDSGGVDDKVTALESGADDFLLKPISPRELLVRLAATLRAQAVAFPEEDIQTLGALSLYRDVVEISVGAGGERKKLSPKEFTCLGTFRNTRLNISYAISTLSSIAREVGMTLTLTCLSLASRMPAMRQAPR